ncbi:MAG: hypothetical protein ACR2RF_19360 [Geminicoccaceae bacterium]
MTSIGSHQNAALQAVQLLSQRLAGGEPVHARVLGATRHGVSVLIGRETFQLHAPSKLAHAETLTLQGSTSPSASGQSVKIIAWDDRPLPKPMEAHLVAGNRTLQPDAGIIVQKSEIKVVANPVSPEGRFLGPSVALHLQALPVKAAIMAAGEQSTADLGGKPETEPNSLRRTPTDLARLNGSSNPSAYRPAAGTIHGSESVADVGKFEPNGKLSPKVVSAQTPTSSPFSADPLSGVAKNSVDHDQLRGDRARQQELTGTSILSRDGEPTSIKSTKISATVIHRQEAVSEAKGFARTPHPLVLQKALDRSGAVTASVVGRTSTGNILLEAAGQLMRIEQPVDLPPGTTLQVTFVSSQSAWMTPTDHRTPENPDTLLNKLIGLLDDLDRAGRQTTESDHPPSARQLPTPDRHLASRFLGLLPTEAGGQALRGAMSSSPERSGIVAHQVDQIQALTRELGSMVSEFLAGDWRSLTLPFGSDQSQAVSLYFRGHDLDPDDETSDEEAGHKRAQRAVFDVSFSQLGRCQIDALCQEQRFDLMIRSEKPFDPEDRQVVAALFISACEIAGMKGEIVFNLGGFFEPERSSTVARELRT